MIWGEKKLLFLFSLQPTIEYTNYYIPNRWTSSLFHSPLPFTRKQLDISQENNHIIRCFRNAKKKKIGFKEMFLNHKDQITCVS